MTVGAAAARKIEVVDAHTGNRDELLQLIQAAPPGPIYVLTARSTVADVAAALDGLATTATDPNARPACRRAFNALYHCPPGAKPRADGHLVRQAERLMAEGNMSVRAAARAVAKARVAPEEVEATMRRVAGKLSAKNQQKPFLSSTVFVRTEILGES